MFCLIFCVKGALKMQILVRLGIKSIRNRISRAMREIPLHTT